MWLVLVLACIAGALVVGRTTTWDELIGSSLLVALVIAILAMAFGV